MSRSTIVLLIGLLLSGCSSDGDPVLSVEASGAFAGLIFVDRNGDGERTANTDVVVPDVTFSLVRGASDTVGTGTTDQTGVGVLMDVPVGRYRVVVDATKLGDSLQVAESGETVVVKANAPTAGLVPLQHPSRPIREVLAEARGKTAAIQGVALNAWSAFGDSTLHVADTSGVIRAVRVRPSPVVAGDSVRLLGRTGQAGGKAVLADATVLVIGSATAPTPTLLTTAQAATAQQGRLAASLVRIEDARVISARTIGGGDLLLEVNDGTGVLELLLDRHAPIDPENPMLPGARVDATGVLVPTSGDPWQLKPRETDDIEVRIPTATVAGARALDLGRVASVTGVALHDYETFGDGIVHLADGTGSIRVFFSTRLFIAEGDSVTVVGTVQSSGGQRVLSNLRLENHGSARSEPEPARVTSGEAAEASGGTLDAALVEVVGATITAIHVTGATQLLVNDGSGSLTVVLDPEADIDASPYSVSESVNVVGLLVPSSAGTWALKPRADADLQPGG